MAPSPLSAEALLKRPESHALLATLPAETSAVWKYFLLLTETPRPSHKLEKCVAVLTSVADALGAQCDGDAAGNLRLRIPATAGMESVPGVCFQAHMDMVTSANSDVQIDFANDPINVHVDGEWLKAKGTTLGADNGIGVAAGLALLEEASTYKHGPLELLITADEETTMGGALGLAEAPYLTSSVCLNLDSEEEYAICIGCAGGGEWKFDAPVTRAALADAQLVRVHISGLVGGHSGVDIHRGRLHAMKALARVLSAGVAAAPAACVSSFSGGTACNVIPREATATVAVPSATADAFRTAVAAAWETIKEEFAAIETRGEGAPSTLALDVSSVEGDDFDAPLTPASSAAVLAHVHAAPHGVLRMSPSVEGLTETSTNLAIVKLGAATLHTHQFARSSSNSQLDYVNTLMRAFGALAGAAVDGPARAFPGWQPNPASPALAVMKDAHKEVMGRDAHVYAIHAGLESGLVMAKYPGMDSVSIGPQIINAHSPDEALQIETVPRFYKLCKRFVELYADANSK